MLNYNFTNKTLLEIVKKNFSLNINGMHGINHWLRVYNNTQILADYYKIQSPVFELFAMLHDCKRESELEDNNHGKKGALFAKHLIAKGMIILNSDDTKRLIFAISNHTNPNKKAKLYNDLVIQICFDADRLDIGRVGIVPEIDYFATDFAKSLVNQEKYFYLY